jgi:hypothetical protein
MAPRVAVVAKDGDLVLGEANCVTDGTGGSRGIGDQLVVNRVIQFGGEHGFVEEVVECGERTLAHRRSPYPRPARCLIAVDARRPVVDDHRSRRELVGLRRRLRS